MASFIATTSFALVLSIASVFWLIIKRTWGDAHGEKARNKPKRRCQLGVSEFCEELVMSSSDTQIFTGGAYALTLRYFRGCSITSYHYDIVANLMLLTCATHLMSITIVRNYWRYPWLGILRTLICTGVFIVTGILLANQNSDSVTFPSQVPMANETSSFILLPAACFQKGNSQLLGTLKASLSPEKALDAFFNNTPGNRIPGWSNYLMILLLYLVAGFVDILRWFRRGAQSDPNGRRARILVFFHCSSAQRHSRRQQKKSDKKPFFSLGNLVFTLFSMYLLAGIGVSCWTVVTSATYIWNLRSWAKGSGWLEAQDGGQSAEDDATSFGQLVPIFLNLLIIFTVAQVLSRASSKHTDKKFDIYGGVIHDTPPSPPPSNHGGGGGKNSDSNVDVEDLNIGGYLIPGGSKSNVNVHVHQYYSGIPSSDVTSPMSNSVVMSNLPPASQTSSPRPAGNTNSGRWDSITTVSNPSTPGLMQTVTGTPPPQSSGTTPNPGSLGQFHSSPPEQQSSTSASTTPRLGGYYQAQQQANSMSSSQPTPPVQAQAQAPVASSYSAPTEYFQGTVYQQYLQQQHQQQYPAQEQSQQQYQAQEQPQHQEQHHQQYQQYQPYEVDVNHSTPPPVTQAQQTQPQVQRQSPVYFHRPT